MKECFWTRWIRDVLHHIQSRSKWQQHRSSLKKGDIVIIQADHLPPLAYLMARILELISGSDGIPRVANLNTATGLARRVINRLIRLPVHRCRHFAPRRMEIQDIAKRGRTQLTELGTLFLLWLLSLLYCYTRSDVCKCS
ncbi:hypothetical protein AVEN_58581-1 [Araneus ventricosus]|uniref:DUF5641 domain-containing protein n=1 Tax=Araneus ventricosus TaxID=182803 RepID=A0A4Y2GWR2_ARAVE|nr:hypothetical protein AVEN_58581-1 [Araneus ventricosus]